MLYSKDSLEEEAKMLDRMAGLVAELRAINLQRQLRMAEADTMNGDGDDSDN